MTKTITALEQFFLQSGFLGEGLETILSKFTFKGVQKGDLFLEEGKIVTQLAFLESGAFHYFYNIEGAIRTTFVHVNNVFMTSMNSFLNSVPNSENIQAITNSTIAVIYKNDLMELINKVVGFKDFYIAMLEYQVSCLDKGRLDLLVKTPEERYLRILKEQPELFQKVPLKLLAYTLGMTPRHLSRVRKKIIGN
ncbi:MAG: Crp/Fnr family transcriptional regulator [Aureispira sp.]|nr:Crp/Fnr family transcriptional regulator [Aureispira sp.]